MTGATRVADLPADHVARRLLSGRTPWIAAAADPRFAYRLVVPPDVRDDEAPLALWVFVHGTDRAPELYLDRLAALAAERRAVVMTPLFPAGTSGPDDFYNYQQLVSGGVRYDDVLLGMVEEVAHRWGADGDRFFLHGFSGGGQFANRFALRHPGRLAAVSIGAPGVVVLPDSATPAPGLVPVQVVVGSLDDDPTAVAAPGAGPREGRLTRARRLAAALDTHGWPVRLDVVEGAGHDGGEVLAAVTAFLLGD